MHKYGPRASLSNSVPSVAGLTLIELLVTLVIVSILAGAALPFAETVIGREKEIELRRALRDVREAIDHFNEDWQAGRIPKTSEGVSEDGYPRSLQILVTGIDSGDVRGRKLKYLRKIPRDPYGDQKLEPEQQWILRGYQDEVNSIVWGKKDVYDIKSTSEAIALDGTPIREW